jgi:hypothetical protein
MKNIVIITLTILAILIAGFFATVFFNEKSLSSYLPMTFQTAKKYTLFQTSTLPEEHTIQLGVEEEISFDVVSASGQYVDEDNKLGVTVWVEKISKDVFEVYKQKAWEIYQSPSRKGTSEQATIDEHEVYLSFRTIDENVDDTSKMVTMGGGYVFFPEENIAVAYTIYNPRLSSCEDIQNPDTCLFDKEKPLPTIEDSKSIAKQIIASQKTY